MVELLKLVNNIQKLPKMLKIAKTFENIAESYGKSFTICWKLLKIATNRRICTVENYWKLMNIAKDFDSL